MSQMWMVRAGRASIYVEEFLTNNMVAIGWHELGPIEPGTSKKVIIQQYKEAFPQDSEPQVNVQTSQIWRFINEVKINDRVVTYDRERRLYYIGTIVSEVKWNPDFIPELRSTRDVIWTHQVSRDRVNAETKNTLGAIQTIFSIRKSVADELLNKAISIGETDSVSENIHPQVLRSGDTEQDKIIEDQIKNELLEKSEEAIEDRIANLDWIQVQDLVAGILRAMGYRTLVSPKGSDRGVDIFASPDGLGLEEPRIFVEVKHRPSQSMSAQDVRSFLGGRSHGDRCLYVSTGGFTKDARYEADRSTIPLRLLTLVDLRKLLVDYYENIDESTRNLVPLKRVYVLAD